MCRGRHPKVCTELGFDAMRWSRRAPLEPPAWIRDELDKVYLAIQTGALGSVIGARGLLEEVRSDDLRYWFLEHAQVAGKHRNKRLGIAEAPRGACDPVRNPNAALKQAVLKRDRYTCRYCDIRLIDPRVLKAFSAFVGKDVFGSGRAADDQHGSALVARAQVDHVVPHHLGGRTSEENLVACCYACNYAKDAFTAAQLGIDDPRTRPPHESNWDGLMSCLLGLRTSRNAQALNWLERIRIGDAVIVPVFGHAHAPPFLGTVTMLTDEQVVVDANGKRRVFSRADGLEIHGRSRVRIREATPSELSTRENRERHMDLRHALKNFPWSKLSIDQLQAVLAQAEEFATGSAPGATPEQGAD